MSRAAIVTMLRHHLHRQPTPEEYRESCAILLRFCPSGRVYVPSEKLNQSDDFDRAANLVRGGASIRAAAKAVGIKKSRLHAWLSKNPAVIVDSDQLSLSLQIDRLE